MEDIPTSSFLKDLQAPTTSQVHPVQLERQSTMFQNLACLIINNCKWLKEVPDVSAKPELLKNFPAGNALKCLKMLNLTGCRSIKNFPEVSQSEYLDRVYLSDTAIDIESISIQDLRHPFIVLPGDFHFHVNKESVSLWIKKAFPALSVSFVLSTDEDLTVELCICVGRFKAILRKEFFINK